MLLKAKRTANTTPSSEARTNNPGTGSAKLRELSGLKPSWIVTAARISIREIARSAPVGLPEFEPYTIHGPVEIKVEHIPGAEPANLPIACLQLLKDRARVSYRKSWIHIYELLPPI